MAGNVRSPCFNISASTGIGGPLRRVAARRRFGGCRGRRRRGGGRSGRSFGRGRRRLRGRRRGVRSVVVDDDADRRFVAGGVPRGERCAVRSRCEDKVDGPVALLIGLGLERTGEHLGSSFGHAGELDHSTRDRCSILGGEDLKRRWCCVGGGRLSGGCIGGNRRRRVGCRRARRRCGEGRLLGACCRVALSSGGAGRGFSDRERRGSREVCASDRGYGESEYGGRNAAGDREIKIKCLEVAVLRSRIRPTWGERGKPDRRYKSDDQETSEDEWDARPHG